MGFISNTKTKLSEFWQKLKTVQRILLIAVIVLMVVGISTVVIVGSQVEYAVLYSGMDQSEAGQALAYLTDELKVDAKMAGNGTIMVSKDRVYELAAMLAAQGYPSTGTTFDIYDQASGIGKTQEDREVYARMQTQKNIEQTLRCFDKVNKATVLLTLAKKNSLVLSSDEKVDATASVVLTLDAGESLTKEEALSLRQFVATSVLELKPENVTLMDSNMTRYDFSDSSEGVGAVSEQIAIQETVRKGLEKQIYDLLEPAYGMNKMTAAVNIELNFDKQLTNSITLSAPDPDAENMGIITSMEELDEYVVNDANADGEPGLDDNGGGPGYMDPENTPGTVYRKISKKFNTELNEINEQIEKAQGQIKSFNCAVILDGNPDEMADQIELVRTMLATAFGVETNVISVSARPFQARLDLEEDLVKQEELDKQIRDSEQMQTIILAAAIFGSVLLVLIVIFAMLGKRKKRARQEAERIAWEQQEQARIEAMADEEITPEDVMNVDKDDTLEQIQRFVEKDPESVAMLLRNWLSDDYGGRR